MNITQFFQATKHLENQGVNGIEEIAFHRQDFGLTIPESETLAEIENLTSAITFLAHVYARESIECDCDGMMEIDGRSIFVGHLHDCSSQLIAG